MIGAVVCGPSLSMVGVVSFAAGNQYLHAFELLFSIFPRSFEFFFGRFDGSGGCRFFCVLELA
jgi:hypothetical protein